MTTLLEIVFWASLALIVYTYLGYGILLYLINKVKGWSAGRQQAIEAGKPHHYPFVSLVVAAYNEEDIISEKLANSLALDYPSNCLEIIIVTDGSTDRTPDIVAACKSPLVRLMHLPGRSGKTAAINRAAEHASGEVLVFSDANTMLNTLAVKNIVKYYADPMVGAVAGEKRVVEAAGVNGAVAEEGLYWKYESFLKRQDAAFYTVVGAAGELFSVRASLYQAVPLHVVLDDFYISLNVCREGYMVKYAADAYGEELPSANVKEEKKRKVRIAAGGFQSMVEFRDLMLPFHNWRLAFQYVSHRVLRWAVCPFLLPVVVLSNIALVWFTDSLLYQVLLAGQALFYLAAIVAALFEQKGVKVRYLSVAFYFTFMNWSVYLGLIKFLSKSQSSVWERSARTQLLTN